MFSENKGTQKLGIMKKEQDNFVQKKMSYKILTFQMSLFPTTTCSHTCNMENQVSTDTSKMQRQRLAIISWNG